MASFRAMTDLSRQAKMEPSKILVAPFLGVCKKLLVMTDVFGAAFSPVRKDIGRNITIVEATQGVLPFLGRGGGLLSCAVC